MLITLALPRIGEHMTTAVIRTIHAQAGAPVMAGSKLLDISIDLSALGEQDCPPVALFRIALLERVWLRELTVAAGDEVAVGALMGRFTTDPAESLEGAPARPARITVAGIVDPSPWWEAP